MVKRILSLILVIIFISLILGIIVITRNINIINMYCKKSEEYAKLTNFYAKYEDDYGLIREVWRKDNKGMTKDYLENGTSIVYVNDNELWNIMDVQEADGTITKTADRSEISSEDEGAFIPVIETRDLGIEDGFIGKIKAVFKIRITTEEISGKLCYKFDIGDDQQIFVNTTDFMKIKEVSDDVITTELKEYKLNSVEDKDISLPNLEGYEGYNL